MPTLADSRQISPNSYFRTIYRVALLFVLLSISSFAQAPAPRHPGASSSPGALTTAVKQALAAEQHGDFALAEQQWTKVTRLQPTNAQAFAHLGLAQARQEHYTDAITSYRSARKLNPALPQLNLNLGLALFKAGSFHEAVEPFEKEHKRIPDDQKITILLGMAHYGAREYNEATPYLKEAASRDEKNLALRLTLAHCYLWTKQFQAVLDVYKEILLVDPDSAEADMLAGEALDEKGDNAGAEAQFRAAEKANPKEPNVHFGLAYLLWTQKRYEEAIPEFYAELANDPENNQAMIYLGDTYVRTEQFDKAKELLEKALSYKAVEPLIHLDLGIVYQETGNNEAAVREFTRTIELEPDYVNAHFRLAKVYQSMGKRDEAKVEFTKASSLNKKADKALYERISEGNARPNPKVSASDPTKPSDDAPTDHPK